MLSIGIVGLPNVGKSTLFNALTKSSVLAANYPFATIEPNIGIVEVPDLRLNELAELYDSQKIIPATIKFVDIAGLVKGANSGEGMGNQFLSRVRECDAICQVVRAFDDSNVSHVSENRSPKSDIEIINTELVLADLQTATKRLVNVEKLAKSDTKLKPYLETIKQAKNYLEDNKPLFDTEDLELDLIKDLGLLTAKPVIYIINADEALMKDKDQQTALKQTIGNHSGVFINAKLEDELNDLEPEESIELLKSYGQDESGLEQLINKAYDLLNLQSYLTAGPKEVRAWTIKKGSTAPQAAGVIG